jgi:serine beta-lactamase-like protein LACTB
MRIRRYPFSVAFAAFVVSAAAAQAQTDPYAPAVAFTRSLVATVMQESGTPGMSVAVGIDGDIIWAEGFGFADLEQEVPVGEETRFRIGSVSKPVTAAAVGLLLEQGKLDLDAPVQRYVPSFPEKPWPISTRQAAGHLAGIRHYREGESLSSTYYPTVLEGLEIFQDEDLLFEPGTRWSYSSYGWNLVSAVVEGASGEEFLTYMQREVFDRLGMTHTSPDHNSRIVPHRTRFYVRTDDGQIENAPYVDNSYKWAGGGFLSTPSDLVRFGFAHFETDLRASTIAELWTPLETKDGESTGYGIGWFVVLEDGKVVVARHGGGSVGGGAGFVTYPQRRAVVAVTGNMTGAPTGGMLTGGMLTHLILEAFLDPVALVAPPARPDLSGEFACTVTEDDETKELPLLLMGAPDAPWGRLGARPIIQIMSGPSETRIIAPEENGELIVLHLTDFEPDQLSGSVNRGQAELSCERHRGVLNAFPREQGSARTWFESSAAHHI